MKDVVSIAGMTVANQAFGSISNKSDEFDKQPNDGLIGMAFGTIAQSRQPTYFENLIKEYKLSAPLFSVHLSRHQEKGSSVRKFSSPPLVLQQELSIFERLFLIGVSRLHRSQMDHGSCDVASRGIESAAHTFHLVAQVSHLSVLCVIRRTGALTWTAYG